MASPPRLDDPLELLAAPPLERYSLLELSVEWDELVGVEAQLASALRLFVITRDPLDWIPDRGSAWATSNSDGDTLEVPVYVTLEEVQRRVAAVGRELADALAPLCERVVLSAVAQQGVVLAGAYPELAFRGEVAPLLSPGSSAGRLGTPRVGLHCPGWEPVGLGAIQDLVQEAFGPVDFDRSKVILAPTGPRRLGCPACAGQRFGFPAELDDARELMCGAHAALAGEITASRIARARASNSAGWRAIAEGSSRINGLPGLAVKPLPQRRHAAHGRNDPCPCGSGRKYKHCCGN